MLSDLIHILKIIEQIYCCKSVIKVISDLGYAWKNVP
jgi:hypothetical protein